MISKLYPTEWNRRPGSNGDRKEGRFDVRLCGVDRRINRANERKLGDGVSLT